MDKPIEKLFALYSEEIALKARKCIVNKVWDIPEQMPYEVVEFKSLFKESLIYLRSKNCTVKDKQLFLEAIFRGELRILLHNIVDIKHLDVDKAEDVCQDIIISLFKRLLSDSENSEKIYQKQKKELIFSGDDYKSFVFYCLKSIKNFGKNKFKTKIQYTIEEFK